MNPETIEQIFKHGSEDAILFIAIGFLFKGLKTQYEARICALEKASAICETDRAALHARFEEHLASLIPKP